MTDKNLLITVIYLLFAGTVMVSTTVRYTLLLLLKYPHVQGRRLLHQPALGTEMRAQEENVQEKGEPEPEPGSENEPGIRGV